MLLSYQISLNLLPPRKQRRLRFLLYLIITKFFISIIFIALAFGSSILLVGRYYVQRTFEDVIFQITLVTKEYAPVNAEVRALNTLMHTIDRLRIGAHQWSALFAELATRAPPGVHFSSVAIREKDNKLTVQGRAANRAQLLTFEEALRGAPFVTAVAHPLENLLQRENVLFTIEATIDATRLRHAAQSP